MFKKIALILISPISGRKVFQKFFEALYRFSLAGMNIGGGASPNDSGERFVLTYIKKRLKPNNDVTIFDVGANTGDSAFLAWDVFSKNAKIYSFEPSDKTYRKLKSNIGKKTNITAYNFGFGDINSKVTLFRDSDESGLASVYKRKLDHYNINMDRKEQIELKTVDSFCREQKINHIHFLKLDVEGNEMKVLEGAKNMLRLQVIDFIQFEFGGCDIDSRTFFQDFYYLLKDKYKISRVLKDGLYEIKHYNETNEAYLTTNYLAELKIKSDKGRIGNRS